LGLRGYKSYWKYAILSAMLGHMFHPVTVQELSLETGILLEDVVSTLKELNLDYRRPSPQGELAVFDNLAIRRWLHEHERPRDLRLDPSVLDWRSPKILESEDMEDEDDDQEDEEEEEQEEDEDEIEEEEEEEQPEPKKAAQKKAEQKKVEQKKVEQKNVEAPKEVAIEDDTMDTDSVSGSSDFDL
jgi:Mg-chelatase subunit ChlI